MKKVVTEFDAEKQSLRMYFQGRSAENIISAVLVGLIGLGIIGFDCWLVRGIGAALQRREMDGEIIFLIGLAVVCLILAVGFLLLVLNHLFGKKTGTLDENGFRYESRLGPLRYGRKFAPLEDVIYFYARRFNPGQQDATPIYDLHVMQRNEYSESDDAAYGDDISLLYSVDTPELHHKRLQRLAAMCNALLRRLKRGKRVRDKAELKRLAKKLLRKYAPLPAAPKEIVTHVETVNVGDARPVAPRRPDGTPWRLKSGYDGSVFWRTEVFSIKMILHSSGGGCLAAAVAAGFLWLSVYVFLKYQFNGPVWFHVYFIIAMLGMSVGMIGRACGEILKPWRRIFIRVNRHELRKETRTLGIRRTRGVYPLGGLAKIELEQRGAFCVLVFENAAGKTLAEIADLTVDEARWIRDEILRNF